MNDELLALFGEDMNGGGVISSVIDLGEAGVIATVNKNDFITDDNDIDSEVELFENNLNTFLNIPYSVVVEKIIGDEAFLLLERTQSAKSVASVK